MKEQARTAAAFEIEQLGFSDDQAAQYQILARSDIALMPSWHEGFGLSGWEALCAGVPLICSTQSGLALLVEQLKQRMPDVDFSSILPINLAGGAAPGSPVQKDIDELSEALQNAVASLNQRKQAALKLARLIKRDFTWERCAHQVIEQVGWGLPTSTRWTRRKEVAERAAQRAGSAPNAEMVLEALDVCRNGYVERDWSLVCSALNYISDVAGEAGVRDHLRLCEDLSQIGQAISDGLQSNASLPNFNIRNTGFLDLCWRYMAAACKAATTFRAFTNFISSGIQQHIFADGFLRRELLFYACRFSADFDQRSLDLACRFFAPLANILKSDKLLPVRFARLAIAYPSLLKVAATLPFGDEFQVEIGRCNQVMRKPFDLGELIANSPELAATSLALSGIRRDLSRQTVDQGLAFIADLQNGKGPRLSWRGDKRLPAALLSTCIPSGLLLGILELMAQDEEEAIRWAALDLAFSKTLRARLESHATSAGEGISLARRLGAIVDIAVNFDGGHPWLIREFFLHYLVEHTSRNELPTSSLCKFVIHDFPISRSLFGPLIGEGNKTLAGILHPEVIDARESATDVIKRVLLVLPALNLDSNMPQEASRTSTPPLGLGLLAARLASEGHDVQLADCHRFPMLVDEVISKAKTFDLIGCNVVFSTVRTTRVLLSRIREATQRPVLVIGGPAANLDAWRFSAVGDDRKNWDFVISSNATENLMLVVDSLKYAAPWPTNSGLQANFESALVAYRDVECIPPAASEITALTDTGWMQVLVDRRIFQGPAGQYEPSKTRMQNDIHEAHVVMSRGCDWQCGFCTERRQLSGGERRREAESVLNEIRVLVSQHSKLRIQFIDDNLLPQIAAPGNSERVKVAQGIVWAEKFLLGLTTLRRETATDLSWRGIFRLEDFAAYEEEGPPNSFVQLLADSGCNMLAFGVEHGNAGKRHSLKAGGREFDNAAIVALFSRLRKAGIFTKAYFILGGPKETEESAKQTISFAIESGSTLAYFALYKEFVKAASVLQQERVQGDEETESLLTYDQLSLKWDSTLSSQHFDENHTSPPTCQADLEVECYQKLAALGFRFQDLVKYNDYHGVEGESGKVLRRVTWGQPSEYFKLVESAYRKFYLRPQFVTDYQQLMASGY